MGAGDSTMTTDKLTEQLKIENASYPEKIEKVFYKCMVCGGPVPIKVKRNSDGTYPTILTVCSKDCGEEHKRLMEEIIRV